MAVVKNVALITLGGNFFFFFKRLKRLKAVKEVDVLTAMRLFEKFEGYIDSVIISIRISFKNIFTMGTCILRACWIWEKQELLLVVSDMTIFRI